MPKRMFAKITYPGHIKGRVVVKHISTDSIIKIDVFTREKGKTKFVNSVIITPGIYDGQVNTEVNDGMRPLSIHQNY